MITNHEGHVRIITIGITMLGIFLLAGDVSAATPVSSCGVIYSPGEYVLTRSIINSTAIYCINIISSNVIFDGAGYTIDGTATSGTKGVYVYNSSKSLTNVTVKNLKVTDWYYGIYYVNIQTGSIINNTASSNVYGILLSQSSYSILNNNTASLNNIGIMLYQSNYNTLTSSTAISNDYGIDLSSSSYNMLISNNASNNRNYGVFLFSFGFTGNYNIIYNNYFNNINNSRILSIPNSWNTTKKAGTNIVGGHHIGGNFWGNPNGTGFSQTCTDRNGDGICDSPYTLFSNNIDYLPLAYKSKY
ncbi:MAG: NosD domain-containing protein [Candidatus Methanoperedens sp.]|nr:right-handed parallel beta-helix repeat-containing protein [Candidatus Methanoperedens sp.]MCZ7396081.1 right-handed parallel beta-helix repeat-containing protein [Candidatus Methanoperedens sp.]